MRQIARLALALALLVAALAGCSRPAASVDDTGVPYPEGCAAHHMTMRRCDLVIDSVAAEHGVDRTKAVQALLLGDPGCGPGFSPGALCQRSTSFAYRVRLVMQDGTTVEGSRFCSIEAMFDPACTNTPKIRVTQPIDGYYDTPEGASPVPTIDPATGAEARSLTVPSLDVPIDRVGPFRIDVGSATLANGILHAGSFEVADTQPADITLDESGVGVRILRPDGSPLGGIFQPGWQQGLLNVHVVLEFTVLWFDPGAVLRVRNIVVG